jgi:hypothetical protein
MALLYERAGRLTAKTGFPARAVDEKAIEKVFSGFDRDGSGEIRPRQRSHSPACLSCSLGILCI